ncbi:MAG: hypothetical protein CVU65_02255 [Deltaproteobacteria bacterium HGW-Deltaproteobacteria-22]|jgi:thiol-disulfide isomerase/thioredoxin|nr:MAG: hypothetical protein CVU65_02255 [Deltaproteobacteria bacterium HGW-Deltaproteobacteria-22]
MRRLLLLLTLSVAMALSAGCDDPKPPEAPAFVLPSDGADPCDLNAERPKLVLVLFWLHTCPYCQAEIEQIHALADAIDPARVSIFAIHVEGGAAAAVEAAPMMAHPNVRICWDDLTVSSLYAKLDAPWKLEYIPHMMWVDADGTARRPHTGVTSSGTLLSDMQKLLAETSEVETGL